MSEPSILAALAGSAEGTSVAVAAGDEVVTRSAEGQARHSVNLLPLLQAALGAAGAAPRDLGAVAFARGPGPFTAGRISTATAQGLGLALGVPLLPVSSLAALAHGTGHPRVAAAIEAGQGEVYWGLYRARGDDGQEAEAPEAVVAPGEVAVPAEGQWLGAGSGWDRHGETLVARLGARLQDRRPAAGVSAASVAALARRDWQAGQGVAPAQALPTYLRASYAQPPG